MNQRRLFTSIMVVFVLLNTVVSVHLYTETEQLHDQVETLQSDQQTIQKMIAAGSKSENQTGGDFSTQQTWTASTIFLGYDSKQDTAKAVPIQVTNVPRGGIYTNVAEITVRKGVQNSWRQAANDVNKTQYQPRNPGFLIDIQPPSVWDYVSGGSSALPAAIAIAGTDPTVDVNQSVALTGGLDKYGRVTDVRGIRKKAIAAREDGRKTLIVPAGEEIVVEGIHVQGVRTIGQALNASLNSRNESQGGR